MALENEPGLTVEGWLTSHGLRSVFDKLQSHFSEVTLTLQDYSSMNASEIQQLSDEIGLSSVFERVKFRQAFKSLSRLSESRKTDDVSLRSGVKESESSTIPMSAARSGTTTTNMIFLGKKEGEIIDNINELLESVNRDLDRLRRALDIGRDDYADKRDHLCDIIDSQITQGLRDHCLKQRMKLESMKLGRMDQLEKEESDWSSQKSRCESSMDEFLRIITLNRTREKKTSMVHRLSKKTFIKQPSSSLLSFKSDSITSHRSSSDGGISPWTGHSGSVGCPILKGRAHRSDHTRRSGAAGFRKSSSSSSSPILRIAHGSASSAMSETFGKESSKEHHHLTVAMDGSIDLHSAWNCLSFNCDANHERRWFDCQSRAELGREFITRVLGDCLCFENCLLDTAMIKSSVLSTEDDIDRSLYHHSSSVRHPAFKSSVSAPIAAASSSSSSYSRAKSRTTESSLTRGTSSLTIPEMVISLDSTSTADDELINGHLDDELLAAVDIYNEELSSQQRYHSESLVGSSASPGAPRVSAGMVSEPGGAVSVIESVSGRDDSKSSEVLVIPIPEHPSSDGKSPSLQKVPKSGDRRRKKAKRKREQYQSVARQARSKREVHSVSAAKLSRVSSGVLSRDQRSDETKTDFSTIDSLDLYRSVRRREKRGD